MYSQKTSTKLWGWYRRCNCYKNATFIDKRSSERKNVAVTTTMKDELQKQEYDTAQKKLDDDKKHSYYTVSNDQRF